MNAKLGAGLAALLLASVSGAALAQDAANDDATVLGEIVVTAQKRAERLQDVPLSITALTAEQIEKRGFDEFTDYARTVPGLSFIDRGSGRNKITLRGVSTGTDQNHQSPIGVYIDEMPVSYPNNEPDLRLFDVDRIEVLRGPQGTLYGSGSMGGTIKVITAKPRMNVTEGALAVQASQTRLGGENWAANGMVNLPLAEDQVAARLVGYYRNDSGFVDNQTLGQSDVNTDETWGARFSLAMKPTDRLDVTATAMWQRSEFGGTQETDPTLGGLTQRRAVPEIRTDRLDLYNLSLQYDLGWASLTSSSSYLDRTFDDERDVTAFLGVPVAVWLHNTVPTKTFAQEIRLASAPGEGPIDWIGGLYFSDEKSELNQLAQHAGLFGLPTTTPLLDNRIATTNRQIAAFGELGWNITDQWKLTAGLRAFRVKQTFAKAASGPLVGAPTSDAGSSTESKLNPKINLSFKPTRDVLLYAQAAQGFRVGGPNTTVPPLAGSNPPAVYESDSLWNYEVGAKTAWLDGRITLNASLFYIDWSDIQVTVTRTDGFSYITNGDTAVSKGAELEFAARPVDGLELGVTAAYTDAYLTADSKSGAGKKGDAIPAVPQITWNVWGRYTVPVGDAWSAYGQFDWQYVDDTLNGFASTPPTPERQDSYQIVNFRFGVEMEDLDLALFINNAFDERAELYVDRTLSDRRVNLNRPRTIGVSVSKKF